MYADAPLQYQHSLLCCRPRPPLARCWHCCRPSQGTHHAPGAVISPLTTLLPGTVRRPLNADPTHAAACTTSTLEVRCCNPIAPHPFHLVLRPGTALLACDGSESIEVDISQPLFAGAVREIVAGALSVHVNTNCYHAHTACVVVMPSPACLDACRAYCTSSTRSCCHLWRPLQAGPLQPHLDFNIPFMMACT
jgi:hypothetical protein